MAALARHCLTRFMDSESSKCSSRHSFHNKLYHVHNLQVWCVSMNGCGERGEAKLPMGTVETTTLAAVPSPALAMDTLNLAIARLKTSPPPFNSGIIRLQFQ
ncbi:putative isochorismate synthase [Corchorus olitorius]|uniref:Isochorismate synthase n=1 Tax=Corchorus olitorius TaxID=93759 RepID=A0A1R3KPI9_9ROSI|nr:putative isochorismate synthase [Corchorus olitorius]